MSVSMSVVDAAVSLVSPLLSSLLGVGVPAVSSGARWVVGEAATVGVLTVSGVLRAHEVVLAQAKSLDEVLGNARNWLMGIAGALATFFLTVAGVRYLAAGGDPGEVERAKGALRAAAIGYGIAVLAPVLYAVLRGIVGQS